MSTESSPYVLETLPEMLSNPQPRLELRELVNDPEMRSLFIRAFINVQKRSDQDVTSFAKIASIHGSNEVFDGVNPFPDQQFRGYCQHGTQLFGPWHRPYIMMLEQELYKEVNKVATEYYGNDIKYSAAAQRFRFPFWDWGKAVANQQDALPEILIQPKVKVATAAGSSEPEEEVDNPLYSFTISPEAARRFGVPLPLATSVRYPEQNDAGVVQSATEVLQQEIWDNLEQRRSGLVLLLTNPGVSYYCFSNHTRKPSGTRCRNAADVESLHDTLHGLIGGGGNMSRVPLAAFDPIFFLHHCNVDRLLALYEGINPTQKIRTTSPATETPQDPFYPFRKTPTEWWTPEDVMAAYDTDKTGTRRLGYYYPEFADPSKTSPDDLLAQVKKLYDIAPTPFRPARRRTRGLEPEPEAAAPEDAPAAAAAPSRERTFLALPEIDTSKIVGSAILKVSLQLDAPADAPPPVFAGSVGIFQRVDPSSCDNCSKQVPLRRSMLDITRALHQLQANNPNHLPIKIIIDAEPLEADQPDDTDEDLVLPLGEAFTFTTLDGVPQIDDTPTAPPAAAAAGPSAGPAAASPAAAAAAQEPPAKKARTSGVAAGAPAARPRPVFANLGAVLVAAVAKAAQRRV